MRLFLWFRVGEGRACWSLGNAYVSLGDHKQALHYARKHLDISKEVSLNSENTKKPLKSIQAVLFLNTANVFCF